MNRPSYKELWLDEHKDREEQLQWIRDAVDGNAKFRNSEPPYSEEEELARKIMQMHARIAECESALISMVQQFFYNKDGEDAFRHAFMSAEEEAATYLVEHGIACWTDDYKSAIRFIGA